MKANSTTQSKPAQLYQVCEYIPGIGQCDLLPKPVTESEAKAIIADAVYHGCTFGMRPVEGGR